MFGFGLFVLFMGSIMILMSLPDWLMSRYIRRARAARISQAAGGLVKIRGRVVASELGLIDAPLTGRTGVWADLTVKRGTDGAGEAVLDETFGGPFFVDDGSGAVARVLPEGADIRMEGPDVKLTSPNEYPLLRDLLRSHGVEKDCPTTFRERVLQVGDEVAVIGRCRREPPLKDEGDRVASSNGVVMSSRSGRLIIANRTDEQLLGELGGPFAGTVVGLVGMLISGATFLLHHWGGLVTVSEGWGAPSFIAADSRGVYWMGTRNTSGVLISGPEQQLARGHALRDQWGLAIDGENVYWLSEGGLMKMPRGGGVATTLARAAYPEVDGPVFNGLSTVAVDSTNVYWVTTGSEFGKGHALMKVPTGGGMATVLAATGRANAIAVDDRNVYWSSGGIMKVPIGGGLRTLLFQGETEGVVAASGTVYWTTSDSVMKAAADGGPSTTLASGQDHPVAIALRGDRVYWANERSVTMVRAGGGAPTTLASYSAPAVRGLAAAEGGVYWIYDEGGRDGGEIVKLPIRE